MKKPIVNIVNSLNAKLLEFPKLVDSLEKKELDFIDKLFRWIKDSEEIFLSNNLSNVSELSGLKSKVISQKFSENRSLSKKLQLKAASEILYELQSTVLKVITPYEKKINDARELIRQLLAIISQMKLLKYDPSMPFDNFVLEIWKIITSTDQLKAGAISLKTTLTMIDIQLLIADELDLADF